MSDHSLQRHLLAKTAVCNDYVGNSLYLQEEETIRQQAATIAQQAAAIAQLQQQLAAAQQQAGGAQEEPEPGPARASRKRRSWGDMGPHGKRDCTVSLMAQLQQVAQERDTEPERIAANLIHRWANYWKGTIY